MDDTQQETRIRLEQMCIKGERSLPVKGYKLVFPENEEMLTIRVDDLEIHLPSDSAVILNENKECMLVSEKETSVSVISFSHACIEAYGAPFLSGCTLLSAFFVYQSAEQMPYIVFQKITPEIEGTKELMFMGGRECDGAEKIIAITQLISILLLLCCQCRADAVVNTQKRSYALNRIIRYLSQHYAHTTLSEMGKALNYHPNSINNILKKEMGVTFLQVQEQMRMEEAARLLQEKNGDSVQVIADKVGYGSISNFYARFRAHYQMTPGEYREKWRSE